MEGEHNAEGTALTEAQLRSAAERAVAGSPAVAAVLFGSRARATATPESDWDVCLVTNDEDARGETERKCALEADATLWSDPRRQILWKARDEFDRGVNAGSVEEAIAREGIDRGPESRAALEWLKSGRIAAASAPAKATSQLRAKKSSTIARAT